MNKKELEPFRFPVGRFSIPSEVTADMFATYITTISRFPKQVEAAVEGLTAEQLRWRYRPDGWCIQQVVHHCADSHMNAFTRFKLALTEPEPTIKPYMEDRWAQLPDTLDTPIQSSLEVLKGLHDRWTVLLANLTETDYFRTYFHSEDNFSYRLDAAAALYAWHCNHHLGHIEGAKAEAGRFGSV